MTPTQKGIFILHHGPEETSCFAQEGCPQEEVGEAQVAQAPQQQEGCRAQAQEEELQEGLSDLCTASLSRWCWFPMELEVLPGYRSDGSVVFMLSFFLRPLELLELVQTDQFQF